ncbi:hypothetical protein ES705_32589 [subsurface metagenome]
MSKRSLYSSFFARAVCTIDQSGASPIPPPIKIRFLPFQSSIGKPFP